MAGKSYHRLAALDNSFLVFERSNCHMHVASTAIFETGPLATPTGGVDIERVRAYIASRLHLIPRYRQRLHHAWFLDRPVWVDDDRFNLNYHVRHTSLPRPGDASQLKHLSARIMSQQLDRGKPLWELWIAEGLEGGRFAMISKVHHCMIDGISGVDLFEVLLDRNPEAGMVEDPPVFVPRPGPEWTDLLRDEVLWRARAPLRMALRTVREPRRLASRFWENLSAIGETLGGSLRIPQHTPINEVIGPHRRFDWLAMDLAALKDVKNRLGGTLNDVVLATVAGAVRRFLQRRRVDCEAIEFRVMAPVSVRSESEHGTLGNRVTAWLTELPVSEKDPKRRLAKVRKTTAGLKDSKQAMGAEVLSRVTEWTGSTLLSLAVRLSHRARLFDMVVTNVPGPQVPLYLLGARMLEAYPQVPLFVNNGLGIALFSYAGKLFWGINADWDVVPDLHYFVESIAVAFRELQEAAREVEVTEDGRKRQPARTATGDFAA